MTETVHSIADQQIDRELMKWIAFRAPGVVQKTGSRVYEILDIRVNRGRTGTNILPTNRDAWQLYMENNPFNPQGRLKPRRYGESSHRFLEAYLTEIGLLGNAF